MYYLKFRLIILISFSIINPLQIYSTVCLTPVGVSELGISYEMFSRLEETKHEAHKHLEALFHAAQSYRTMIQQQSRSLTVKRNLIMRINEILRWRRRYYGKKDHVVLRTECGEHVWDYDVLYIDFSSYIGRDFPIIANTTEGTGITFEERELMGEWGEAQEELLEKQDAIVRESVKGHMDDLIMRAANSAFKETLLETNLSAEEIKKILFIREIMRKAGYILAPIPFTRDKEVYYFFMTLDHSHLFVGHYLRILDQEPMPTISVWVNDQKLVEFNSNSEHQVLAKPVVLNRQSQTKRSH